MLLRKSSCRWLVGIGVAGMLGLTAVLMPPRPASGQKPPQEESKSATEVKPPKSAKADSELEQQINQAKDELELLELQLEAKKVALRIDEARLKEAKRWKAHYEELLRSGKVTEDRLLAANDDVADDGGPCRGGEGGAHSIGDAGQAGEAADRLRGVHDLAPGAPPCGN